MRKKMSKTQSISFPILFRYDDVVVPDSESFFDLWQLKHVGGNDYIGAESIKLEARFHWMIDADGLFREFRLIKKRREWARPFRYIVRMVEEHYELLPGRSISVADLKMAIKGCRNDEEKSSSVALEKYLNEYDDSDVFTKEMFESFMNL